MATYADFSDAFALQRIGVSIATIPPGSRTSWPHAHSKEEERGYVLVGTPEVWIDGHVHKLRPGDAIGFPAGTGSAHTIINNGPGVAKVITVGERKSPGDKIVYPLHPERQKSLPDERRWDDPPRAGELGPHDGLPDAQRKRT
jgi:uncharacterized cupin superfamily protein